MICEGGQAGLLTPSFPSSGQGQKWVGHPHPTIQARQASATELTTTPATRVGAEMCRARRRASWATHKNP